MKFRSIRYYVKEGVNNLFKNSLMTLASIAVISACIFIVILSYCITVNVDSNLKKIENTIGITVFPDENLTDNEVILLKQKIESVLNVSNVRHITSKEALENFKESLEEYKEILSGLESDNPLPQSFEIIVSEAVYQKQVLKELKTITGVRKINSAVDITENILNIGNGIRIVSFSMIAILSFMSILIVMNTIKISLYTRRNEIRIMKYVGSTDWFIRWPFLVEGIIIGLIGAILPVVVSWFFYEEATYLLLTKIELISKLIQFVESSYIFPVLMPISILVGSLLGVIGSMLSIRKFLYA